MIRLMGKRIVAIDGYRGLLLFGMTLNHLILFPFIGIEVLNRFLIKYVYSSFGYLSNSEGFFFLAGLVSGIVYGRKVLEGERVVGRVWRRISQMYGIHLVLLLGVVLGLLVTGFVCEPCGVGYFGFKKFPILVFV